MSVYRLFLFGQLSIFKCLCLKGVWRNQPHPRFPLYQLLLPSRFIYQGEELIFTVVTFFLSQSARGGCVLKPSFHPSLSESRNLLIPR